MKNSRRVISLVLVLCIISSVPALAADVPKENQNLNPSSSTENLDSIISNYKSNETATALLVNNNDNQLKETLFGISYSYELEPIEGSYSYHGTLNITYYGNNIITSGDVERYYLSDNSYFLYGDLIGYTTINGMLNRVTVGFTAPASASSIKAGVIIEPLNNDGTIQNMDRQIFSFGTYVIGEDVIQKLGEDCIADSMAENFSNDEISLNSSDITETDVVDLGGVFNPATNRVTAYVGFNQENIYPYLRDFFGPGSNVLSYKLSNVTTGVRGRSDYFQILGVYDYGFSPSSQSIDISDLTEIIATAIMLVNSNWAWASLLSLITEIEGEAIQASISGVDTSVKYNLVENAENILETGIATTYMIGETDSAGRGTIYSYGSCTFSGTVHAPLSGSTIFSKVVDPGQHEIGTYYFDGL